MKRLFQVNTVPVQYFDNKMDAKEARGPLVEATETRPAHFKYTVSKGPDHDLLGVTGRPRTTSHNARSGGHGNGFPNTKRRK